MKKRTFAQKTILRRIEDKHNCQDRFQFYSDSYEAYSDYSDSGYSDYMDN